MSARPACPVCGDRARTLLGTLGVLVWYRCRACGIDYNHKPNGFTAIGEWRAGRKAS